MPTVGRSNRYLSSQWFPAPSWLCQVLRLTKLEGSCQILAIGRGPISAVRSRPKTSISNQFCTKFIKPATMEKFQPKRCVLVQSSGPPCFLRLIPSRKMANPTIAPWSSQIIALRQAMPRHLSAKTLTIYLEGSRFSRKNLIAFNQLRQG